MPNLLAKARSPSTPKSNLCVARVGATYNTRAASFSSSPAAGICPTPGSATTGNSKPVLYRQLALRQGAGAQHPGKAFFVGLGQVVGNGFCFGLQGGQFDDEGLLPLAPAAHGFEQGDAVVVFVVCGQQVGGAALGSALSAKFE